MEVNWRHYAHDLNFTFNYAARNGNGLLLMFKKIKGKKIVCQIKCGNTVFQLITIRKPVDVIKHTMEI